MDLKFWNPDLLKEDSFRMIINASTNSGKSYLIESLLEEYSTSWDIVILVCPSRDQVRKFEYKFTRQVIFKNFNSIAEASDCIEHILNVQDEREENELELFRVLCIFDDVAYDNKTKNSKLLMRLWANGRHLRVSSIFVSQYHSMVSSQMKNNTQIFVIMRLGSFQQIEYVIKNYFIGTVQLDPNIKTKEWNLIYNLYKQLVKTQGDSLVVDNRLFDNNLFYYKAS